MGSSELGRWDRMADELVGALRDIPAEATATLNEKTRASIEHILAIHEDRLENGETR
jgi:hypothetical protein